MTIQLIQGQFDAKDAIDILTQMIYVKVKYHENKITSTANEEDIKFCESKIKRLQKDLFDIRKMIQQSGTNIHISSDLNLS